MKNNVSIKYALSGMMIVFSVLPSHADGVKDRAGVGGALGVSDFLSSSELRRDTSPGPYAAGWVRYGILDRSEVMVALDNVQAKGKGNSSLSRLRPVTANWLQSFGEGPWMPYASLGAGPVWVRRTGAKEEDRMMVSLRAGAGFERSIREDVGFGTGLTYHYVFSDGRYAPSTSALGLQVSLNWYFYCGNARPAPKPAAPPPAALPLDSDGDGVPDTQDTCPGTPKGVAVDALGCPRDSDGDGVPDSEDKCPNTPAGTLVNADGCPTEKVSVSLDVKFATGKAEVASEDDAQFQKVADFMKTHPETVVDIEGHTDSMGSPAKNKALSELRANAVRKVLVEKFHVAPERVTSKGFGAEAPIADNATPEGRAANRRVVAVITADKK